MMKKDTFVSYVLNPRVDDEVLQKYRREIKKHFSRTEKQELRDDPSRIWNLIEKAIVSRPEKERSSVITTPAGMHKDLYRKLPVKENPVCCNSENPWSSGKTEST